MNPGSGGGVPSPERDRPAGGFDLAGWLARRLPAAADAARPAAAAKPAAAPLPPRPGGRDRVDRAAAYLARIPPAVAGERGHARTFHAACILVQGFGLEIDQARPLLATWNQGCQPPWSPAELEHKLADAAHKPGRKPHGWLLGETPSPTPRPRDRDLASTPSSRAIPTDPQPCQNAIPSIQESLPGQEANPHRLAGLILEQEFLNQGQIGLRYWRDEFHAWDGSAYQAVPAGEIRARVARRAAGEFERLYRRALDQPPAGGKGPPRPVPVTSRLVSDVLQALSSLVMVGVREVPHQPAWLPARPDQAQGDFPTPEWRAEDILPARNALIHLPSLMAGQTRTKPPSPGFFNTFALDYDFDPDAPPPEAWLDFLRQIWRDDAESIACLQEWFGYLLTPDTRQQKILMMVGPKRSGRGTIARVLKALAGSSTVVNPTLATLARPFGLAPFIGKPIAVFPDARLSSRPDNAAIVECLLSISGEDDQTIDRKHLPAWTGKLPTRFVLISNELPRLRDVSGALAGRLIILRFTQSFYGKEDLGLLDRLQAELPGILRWAIAGWERLNRRGRFIQPRSARELVATMDELASPISAFLVERCIQEHDASCSIASLYDAWRSWCQEHGRDAVGDEHSFGRDLHAAIPGLVTTRPRTPEGRVRLYQGVRLRTPLDPDHEADRDR